VCAAAAALPTATHVEGNARRQLALAVLVGNDIGTAAAAGSVMLPAPQFGATHCWLMQAMLE